MVFKMPFIFGFIFTLFIVLVINYITQTYLLKKNNHKIDFKSFGIILLQSILISVILTFVV
ncbi:hypothetical protein AWH49_18245 [Domibacillus aminovorans]|uniref:Uncharacterized protein n=1 Tax=Domibacillus aminovorans TaxID=29332 RepID=A0A177L3J9_9BACI|nr:hypothetical protein AWH49_18245 [Domibacillus aminovorans]